MKSHLEKLAKIAQDETYITYDELEGWPREQLEEEGYLKEAGLQSAITCDQCSERCPIPRDRVIRRKDDESMGLLPCEYNPDISFVDINLDRYKQYRIIKRKLRAEGYYQETEVPASTDKLPYVFRRQGDMWEVKYKGKATNVRHQKGMLYIDHLLRNTKKQFKPLELKQMVDPPETVMPLGNENPISGDDSAKKQGGVSYAEANAIADKEALKGYYDSLKQIEAELEEARHNGDQATEDELLKEKDAILQQIGSSTAIRGQLRQFSGNEAKVKDAISTAIRRAVNSIKEHHEELSEHLNSNIKRGNPFCYSSEPEVDWHFE